MKILVTGASGFIGKTLTLRATEQGHTVVPFTREQRVSDLTHLLAGVDAVIHLAGINRPQTEDEFATGNTGLTVALCHAIAQHAQPDDAHGVTPIVVLASSAQAAQDNAYGRSKLAAEQAVLELGQTHGVRTHVYRLPNVFGKWCKPNYNSVVATFCHNIAQNLPIQINDETRLLSLVYIDDVVNQFLDLITDKTINTCYQTIQPEYSVTLGQLAQKINNYRTSRSTGVTEAVGIDFDRALYSTYISYLKPEQFSYPLIKHTDPRGDFVEMLKTKDAGQFSYFTAHPGFTRGGHYHHTKTEKFLVICGTALFKFRHMVTNESFEQTTSGVTPTVVETIPGWTHDITNIGTTEMVVMLWANEIFDRQKPDTINSPL